MLIFNSLGSNYSPQFVKEALSLVLQRRKAEGAKRKLIQLLEDEFEGEARLFYKGRQAITAGLQATGIRQNDRVLTQAFTCFAVYEGIKSSKATPVFVDLEENSVNLSLRTLQKEYRKHKGQVKAVLVQHTLGYPVADIKKIAQWCRRNKLVLIEDLAHSVGGMDLKGNKLGKYGDVVILSFGQDKIWDGTAGGAMVVKKNQKSLRVEGLKDGRKIEQFSSRTIEQDNNLLVTKHLLYPLLSLSIRKAMQWVAVGKVWHQTLKVLNLLPRPVEVNADYKEISDQISWLAYQQFDNLSANIGHRKSIAKLYRKALSRGNSKLRSLVSDQEVESGTNLRFPILLAGSNEDQKVSSVRSKLLQFAEGKGLYISDTWYDAPIAPVRYMKQVSEYEPGSCPNAEKLSQRVINLPTHREVTKEKTMKIVNLLKMF